MEDIAVSGEIASQSLYAQSFDFEMSGHSILVDVKLNGYNDPFLFILDTGAMSVIDHDVANRVKSEELDVDAPITEETELEVIELDTVDVEGMVINNLVVRKGDLSQLDEISGINIDGILGSDFLRFFRIMIDYSNQNLLLTRDYTPSFSSMDGYFLPLTIDPEKGFVPQIEIKIGDDAVLNAIIDTGASGFIIIPESLLTELSVTENEVVASVGNLASGMFSEIDTTYLTSVEEVQIGRLLIPELTATTAENDFALIGQSVLKNFLVSINYPMREMLLLPLGEQDFSGDLASLGLRVFLDVDGDMIISGFWEDSPAYNSDLEIGDEILMVDHTPVDGLSIMEVNSLFSTNEGEQIRIFALSDEGIKEVWLYATELLPSTPENNFAPIPFQFSEQGNTYENQR